MLLFFLFSKEKKKSNSWENFLKKIDGRTMFAPTDLRGKRHNNNVNRLHKRQSKKQRYRYRKGQTKAFASPRRTARETSDSAGRVEQVFPRIIYSPALSGISSFLLAPLQRMWHAVRSESLGLTEKSLITHDKKSPCLRRIPHDQGKYFL